MNDDFEIGSEKDGVLLFYFILFCFGGFLGRLKVVGTTGLDLEWILFYPTLSYVE